MSLYIISALTFFLVWGRSSGDGIDNRVCSDPQTDGIGGHRITRPNRRAVQIGVWCHNQARDSCGIYQTETQAN